jgi:diguanylate cyclase (GGDEF)-like protein
MAASGHSLPAPRSTVTRSPRVELEPGVFEPALDPSEPEVRSSDRSGARVSTAFSSFDGVALIDDKAPAESRLVSRRPRRWILPPHEDPRAESTIRAFAGGLQAQDADDKETSVAPRTGFATRRAWSETFRHEAHRLARYGCRVTVAVMEIEGLDSVAPTVGQGAADRFIPPLAAVMVQNTRAADVLARIGPRRFVALLPETDEVAAINYVERVRCACDMWMEARGLVGRMAIGWAQPSVGGSLADVLGLTDHRVDADRHRQGFGAPPATAVPLTHDEEFRPSRG